MKNRLVISTPHTGTYTKSYESESTLVLEYISAVLNDKEGALTISDPDGSKGTLVIPYKVLCQSVIFIRDISDET